MTSLSSSLFMALMAKVSDLSFDINILDLSPEDSSADYNAKPRPNTTRPRNHQALSKTKKQDVLSHHTRLFVVPPLSNKKNEQQCSS